MQNNPSKILKPWRKGVSSVGTTTYLLDNLLGYNICSLSKNKDDKIIHFNYDSTISNFRGIVPPSMEWVEEQLIQAGYRFLTEEELLLI